MKPLLTILAVAAAMLPATSSGQPPSTPTVLTIRPAGEPDPALKYRLLPNRRELVPGNAAIFYHRAVQMALEAQRGAQQSARATGKADPVPSFDTLTKWLGGPIREFPRAEVWKHLEVFGNTLHELELGARRSGCDWEFDLRDEGFELLLPEIQEMRGLARLVALRARVAIFDGHLDEAFHWTQTGFAMGRHISEGTTLIQALVGVATVATMTKVVEDLIQAPGTPSLYWAFVNRPHPFIDMVEPLDGERSMIDRELHLREIDSGIWSVEHSRRFADDLQRRLTMLTSLNTAPGRPDPDPLSMPALFSRLGMAAMVAQIYPEARRALLAQGRPLSEVDAMPSVQVSLLYTLQQFNHVVDDAFKWSGLPYRQSYKKLEESLQRCNPNAQRSNVILGLLTQLIPTYTGALLASVRIERQFDAFQCIEAIRLYAAAHGGVLPPSLEAITEAPTPVDPATGNPFEYKVDGATATLQAPLPLGAPNHPAFRIRYELKLAR